MAIQRGVALLHEKLEFECTRIYAPKNARLRLWVDVNMKAPFSMVILNWMDKNSVYSNDGYVIHLLLDADSRDHLDLETCPLPTQDGWCTRFFIRTIL